MPANVITRRQRPCTRLLSLRAKLKRAGREVENAPTPQAVEKAFRKYALLHADYADQRRALVGTRKPSK